MAMALQHLPRWFWGRKSHGRSSGASSSSFASSSSISSHTMRDPEMLTVYPSVRPRRGRRKCQRRIDTEHDVVLVPSDGGCISGSESDDSDWSIGWFEPHPPDFASENESENSFAVLVPCYGLPPSHNPKREAEEFGSAKFDNTNSLLLNTVLSKHSKGCSSDESQKYLEQWLSTLNER
eukprot:TRINITY_DN7716_c0_g1_i4.p1 TRINITY_DN7716_c0_g1~~TRINITY_DN7716_c0_g1_i4.p1  ORF type:complete len:179 (+),score=22.20 TRINITY_DN7716_c0_g1_i4:409-945(+)